MVATSQDQPSKDPTFDAFFYGTLLHPRILTRVIGNDGAHLELCPALLREYTRHQVKSADYPAVVPYAQSRAHLFEKDLAAEDRCVRGTLVRGLTKVDMDFLDVFEGDEYTLETVSVHPLAPFTSLSNDAVVTSTQLPIPDETDLMITPAVSAQTYVWCKPLTQLRPDVWSYETFVQQNASKWVGPESQREEYLILEERRALVGGIVRAVGRHGEVIREEL